MFQYMPLSFSNLKILKFIIELNLIITFNTSFNLLINFKVIFFDLLIKKGQKWIKFGRIYSKRDQKLIEIEIDHTNFTLKSKLL